VATVLIIDDDDDVREALKDAVLCCGRQVETAEDGVAALAILGQRRRPCLILLDLVMPRMDGWRFLAVLRSTAALADIPVVVVSAHAESHTPEGADGLLRKPLELSHLRDTVLAHCPNG
jgi:two-component system response regulator MprA